MCPLDRKRASLSMISMMEKEEEEEEPSVAIAVRFFIVFHFSRRFRRYLQNDDSTSTLKCSYPVIDGGGGGGEGGLGKQKIKRNKYF